MFVAAALFFFFHPNRYNIAFKFIFTVYYRHTLQYAENHGIVDPTEIYATNYTENGSESDEISRRVEQMDWGMYQTWKVHINRRFFTDTVRAVVNMSQSK